MKPLDAPSHLAPSPRHRRSQQTDQFDSLARSVARGFSRRQVLAGLGAAVIGAIGVSRTPVAADEVLTDTVIITDDPGDGPVQVIEGPVEVFTPCGPTSCGAGEFCCNPSCGVCLPPGYACAQVACEACGDTVCRPGEKCCHSYYSGTHTCIPSDAYCPL